MQTGAKYTNVFKMLTRLLNLRRTPRVMFQAPYMTSDAWNIKISVGSNKKVDVILVNAIKS